MPRLPRFDVPDLTLHVIQRGNDRAPTFGGTDDPRCFRGCSLRASREHAVATDACVLTSNDVHLPATPGGRRWVGRQWVGRQGSGQATTKVESDPSFPFTRRRGGPRRLTAPAFAHRGGALTPRRPAFAPELPRFVACSPVPGWVFYASAECRADAGAPE